MHLRLGISPQTAAKLHKLSEKAEEKDKNIKNSEKYCWKRDTIKEYSLYLHQFSR